MRKVIAGINMTLDGYCDHTAVLADDETHEHYNEVLRNADTLLYGRTTYQLMENYWPALVENPSGNKPTDDFAVIIDNLEKVVFSHTLENVTWNNSRIATKDLNAEISTLKQQDGKPILIGSPSLIVAAMNLGLIDEFQLCVHPVIAGKGLPLFKDTHYSTGLRLIKTKTFGCGAVVLYYEPRNS